MSIEKRNPQEGHDDDHMHPSHKTMWAHRLTLKPDYIAEGLRARHELEAFDGTFQGDFLQSLDAEQRKAVDNLRREIETRVFKAHGTQMLRLKQDIRHEISWS